MRLIRYLYVMDLWVNNNDVGIPVVLLHLGMTIAKSSGDRETPGDNSNGSLSGRTSRTSKHDVVVLIDIAPSFDDTSFFGVFRWLVIV
jgi:hypothetical protein